MNKVFTKLSIHLKGTFQVARVSIQKKIRRKYKDQHQLTSTTNMDRYPVIFSSVKLLDQGSFQNILSYGCSTGEECFSLRSYFPKSTIVGADINTHNIEKAQKHNTDDNIIFILSDEELLKKNGPYDVVFAMSVLCRWEDTKGKDNCELIYPFSKFEKTIEHLFSLIKPDGLLVVYNANFNVQDSHVSKNLIPIKINEIQDSGFVHKFDKNNLRCYDNNRSVIYSKKG